MKKRMPVFISIIWIFLVLAFVGLVELGNVPFGLSFEDQAYSVYMLAFLIPAYFCMLFSNARHKPRVLFFIFAFIYALGAIVAAALSAISLLGEAMGSSGDFGPLWFSLCLSCIFGFAFTLFGTRRHGFIIDLLSMILPIVALILISSFGDNMIFKIIGAVVSIITLICFIPGTKESGSSSSSYRNSSSGISVYELARQLGNTVHISVDVVNSSGATATLKVASLGYNYITQGDLDKAINFIKNNPCKQDVELKYNLR